MSDAKSVKAPLPFEDIPITEENQGRSNSQYMEMQGSLNYLAIFTRPDLCFTVS